MAAAAYLSKRPQLNNTGMFTDIDHINLTYIIFIIYHEPDDDISVSEVNPSIAAAAYLSKRPQSNNPGTLIYHFNSNSILIYNSSGN
jgi:hypothetical protein